jgi:C4-dicarboxylate transporter, DctM subunit
MLAIGTVMLPAMLKGGYSDKFALGIVMAGGTLGIIIPPSIPLILYGLVTETSITELFIAGIGPGLLLLLAFALPMRCGSTASCRARPSTSAAWARPCAKASGR